ncbi:MAG TPA: protein kinase [Ktedonobacteraceae bacterium]|nr:protein kinase [Ktedonobacteraceae bacterium]
MTYELTKRHLGQQVGNYRLTRWLGQGGFADVYLGEHIYLKTLSAIKMLHVQLSEKMLQNFLQEAQVLAALDHPNIVRILDYGLEKGNPYLVMSYAPNGSIRHVAPRGTRLQPERIVPIVQQAGSALDYAHQHKLIHRDVKPENMLMELHERVLLSDFGLVIVAQSGNSQAEHKLAGTIPYTAPEQLQGRVRFASDQYSLGVVTYEWICGEHPFTGTFAEIASQHLLNPPPSLGCKVPGLPPAVEQVVFKALAKDPTQRYENVTAFANALRDAYSQTGNPAVLADISTGHPGSAQQITPSSDSSLAPVTSANLPQHLPLSGTIPQRLETPEETSTPSAPITTNPFLASLASSARRRQQPANRSVGRRLAVPLIILLALMIGVGIWYSNLLAFGHRPDQRQLTTPIAGRSTTPTPAPQATVRVIPTGIAKGSKLVPTTSVPGTPAPTPTAGQTPTPDVDCLNSSQSKLSFTSVLGMGNPSPKAVTLTNCGGSTGSWTASAVTNGGGSWLSSHPSGGTIAANGNATVQIQAMSSGLQLGLYNGSITFHKGSATWTVTVSYTIVSV